MTTTQNKPKQMTKEEYIKSWDKHKPQYLTLMDEQYGVTQKELDEYFKNLSVSIRIPLNHGLIFNYQFNDYLLWRDLTERIITHSIDERIWDMMVENHQKQEVVDFLETYSNRWFNCIFNTDNDNTPSFQSLGKRVQNKVSKFVDYSLRVELVKYLYQISVEDLLDVYEYDCGNKSQFSIRDEYEIEKLLGDIHSKYLKKLESDVN
jgi:hypothetical protein